MRLGIIDNNKILRERVVVVNISVFQFLFDVWDCKKVLNELETIRFKGTNCLPTINASGLLVVCMGVIETHVISQAIEFAL